MVPVGSLLRSHVQVFFFIESPLSSAHLSPKLHQTSATPGVRFAPVVYILNLTILPFCGRYDHIIDVGNQRSRTLAPSNLSHCQITRFRDICTYAETVLPDIDPTKDRPIRTGRTSNNSFQCPCNHSAFPLPRELGTVQTGRYPRALPRRPCRMLQSQEVVIPAN